MTDISKDFETLCERGFSLACQQAFEDLDREVTSVKHRMASTGNARSSSMAQAVVDAILARFERVLLAFEHSYIAKWAETDRDFSGSDCAWLKAKVTEKLDPVLAEFRSRSNSNRMVSEAACKCLAPGLTMRVNLRSTQGNADEPTERTPWHARVTKMAVCLFEASAPKFG